jgi:hypothetical protein
MLPPLIEEEKRSSKKSKQFSSKRPLIDDIHDSDEEERLELEVRRLTKKKRNKESTGSSRKYE